MAYINLLCIILYMHLYMEMAICTDTIYLSRHENGHLPCLYGNTSSVLLVRWSKISKNTSVRNTVVAWWNIAQNKSSFFRNYGIGSDMSLIINKVNENNEGTFQCYVAYKASASTMHSIHLIVEDSAVTSTVHSSGGYSENIKISTQTSTTEPPGFENGQHNQQIFGALIGVYIGIVIIIIIITIICLIRLKRKRFHHKFVVEYNDLLRSKQKDTYFCDPGNVTSLGRDILNPFVLNFLHDHSDDNKVWVHAPNTSKCVCLVNLQHTDNSQIIIRENEERRNKHDVEVVKEYFNANRANIKSMKMFCSDSPCASCSSIVRMMKNALGDTTNFQLIFSSFYNIARPSCIGRGCTCPVYPPISSEANKQGIRDLKDQGVQMRTFTTQDWCELIALLEHCDRAQGRGDTHADLQVWYQEYKILRDIEDEKMRSDLESI